MENFNSISTVVATIVALVIELVPGVQNWWNGYTSRQKQALVAALVFVVTIGVRAVDAFYYGNMPTDWLQYILVVSLEMVVAAAGTQGAHSLSRKA